jgi:hypothetical protein
MADLKTVKVPDAISDGDVHYDFLTFLWWLIQTQSSFYRNGFGIRVAVRLEKQLLELNDVVKERMSSSTPISEAYRGLELKFDLEDQKYISHSAENPDPNNTQPHMCYPVRPARKLVPFLDALRAE